MLATAPPMLWPTMHPFERSVERRLWTTEIEPDPAGQTEIDATRQADAGRLEEGGRVGLPQATRVDPRQVGRLDVAHGQARHAGKGRFDTVAVAAQRRAARCRQSSQSRYAISVAARPRTLTCGTMPRMAAVKRRRKRDVGNHRKSSSPDPECCRFSRAPSG
jgi:hypothetical protein